MREMKDSGIEWIGEIPGDWEIKKLKYIFSESNAGEVIDKSYWNCGSELLYTCQREPMYSNYTEFPEEKRTSENDLLLTRNATPYIFIPENHCIYSNVVQRITLKREYDRRYIRYTLLAAVDSLVALGDTIPSYNMEIWSNIVLPITEQQHRSANYLDRKCNQIDAIIARQQEVIEKLKAYKLSVITEAVTKGLNPDVPMKDSGVDWIGEIPEHWTVSALRYGLENIQTGPFGSQLHAEDYIEDGIFVINPANIVEGCIVPDNRCSVTELKAQELSRHILNKGDIIFARRGEMGRCAYFGGSFQQYLCGTGCIKIQCNANLMPEFISWFLQTSCVKQYLTLNSVGTTMANLNTTIISGIPVVFPPISEQEKVVEYIKNKICEIDCVLKNKLSIVEKLTKYKKSLIYEVVTGKKEV